MATHVTLDKNGAVYTIAFSEDVERHPCTLDWDVLAELERCIAEVRDSQECRVVIVESRSPKSFVVGANLAVLKTQDETNIGDWVKNGHRIFNQLQHLPEMVQSRRSPVRSILSFSSGIFSFRRALILLETALTLLIEAESAILTISLSK